MRSPVIPIVPAPVDGPAYWCMDCAADGKPGVIATWEHADADDMDDAHIAWCDEHLPANAVDSSGKEKN